MAQPQRSESTARTLTTRLITRLSASFWMRLAAVLAVVGIAVLSLIPGPWQLRTGLPSLLEHWAAYFGAGFVLAFAWPSPLRFILLIGALLIAYANVLELLQHWIPGRSAHLNDALVSSSGAIMGIAVAHWLHPDRQAKGKKR